MTYTIAYHNNTLHNVEGADSVADGVLISDTSGVPIWSTSIPRGTTFWDVLTTASATTLAYFNDGVGDTLTSGFTNISADSLTGVGDVLTSGFTTVILGQLT